MKKIVYGLLAFSPMLAFAQNLGNLEGLVENIKNLLNNVLPVLFALAIIYFFWGLITFIRSAGDPEAAKKGKGIMIWGIVAIFVMAAIFGLITWLAGTVGIDTGGSGGGLIPTI